MLIPNHPDPERLSALASGDTDAAADTSLSAHVSTCVRCTTLVDELGALRTSLSELPDLRPHRPLRLLPEVVDEPSRVDRLGGWARRFFAPVLTAGAALAMVGLIGTTTPALEGLGASGAATATDPAGREGAVGAEESLASPYRANLDSAGQPDEPGAIVPLSSGTDDGGVAAGQSRDGDDAEQFSQQIAVERSPWPMVLFAGLALMVAAGLLRWVLAPRTA